MQYAPADDIVKRSKLLVTQLPSEIEMDYLKALLEKTLGTDKFSLEMSANSTATIIFHNIYTDAGKAYAYMYNIQPMCRLYKHLMCASTCISVVRISKSYRKAGKQAS